MMGLKFIAALLMLAPAIRADIQVKIVAAQDQGKTSVNFSGNNVDIISDAERNTFQLSDSNLKDAVAKYFGKRPDDVFVRSPTPWGDLYQSFGWQQVTTTLSPQSARIVGFQSKPSVVMTQYFENNSSHTTEFTATIKQSVANTVTSTWEKGGEITVGQKIEYGINIEVFSVGGSTSFDYTSSWGESVSKSETVTVGSESGVKIKLEPNQSVIAELEATRGEMQVQVDYEATLSGNTAVNYASPYQGHHFWGLDINAVMSAGGLPRSAKSSEIIKMNFYTDSTVTIKDAKSSRALYSIPMKVYNKS